MFKEVKFIKERLKGKYPRKTIRVFFNQEFGSGASFDDAWEQAHAKPVPEVKEIKVKENCIIEEFLDFRDKFKDEYIKRYSSCNIEYMDKLSLELFRLKKPNKSY